MTPAQIALLERWVEEGAKYEPHWAYVAPAKVESPTVQNAPWVRNPVDKFILAGLEKDGLQPSPEADRPTLIRRLSFDLVGLPPIPEEVDVFEKDASPDAYEKLVDRLLSSPHYGERLAVYWLDLVRFADTVGYHGDQDAEVWPYRDYVINAFDSNMPFDRFTVEQLAGDLLTNATLQQRVASAYNRLNMVTREGGAQAKEYLAKYAADRVRTTTSVWLASTLGCAQCHDHKFDPFSSKDFYRFAAFFADIKEQGVYASSGFYDSFPPVIPVPNPEQAAKLGELVTKVTDSTNYVARLQNLSTKLISEKDSFADAQTRLAAALGETAEQLSQASVAWEKAADERVRSNKKSENVLVVDEDVRGGKREEQWKLVEKAGSTASHSHRRVREQASDGLVQHIAADFATPYKVHKGDRLYAYVLLDPKKMPETLMLQCEPGERKWDHRAYWGKDLIPFGTIGKEAPEHHRKGDLPKDGEWVRLEAELDQLGFEPGQSIHSLAFTQHGGRVWWDDAGVISADLPAESAIAVLKKEAGNRDDSDRVTLLLGYLEEGPLPDAQAAARHAIEEKDKFEQSLPRCVVTEAVPPREMRVLPRGNWMDDSGEVVTPMTPHFLPTPKTDDGHRLTRLDLANWLVSSENPLTARVFVNRLWKLYFGTGLSKVLDDLGTRGEWPREAALLDWLANDFQESHWDVKHMVRLLVTSATYRQSSKPSEKLKEIDPFNRFYARQSRWRLDAEFVRDNALLICGLLTPTIGGESSRPYQPWDYYKELNFPKRTYTPDHDANQYRRGLYTHWQRTFLHPSLAAFDAPSREECTAERNVSNSPLQALALLNDPTYVEAARVLAQHTIEHGGANFSERLRWAWRRALGRTPTDKEEETMKQLFESQSAAFKQDPDAAEDLNSIGYAPLAEKLDQVELAAWTSVTRALLNLHETIVRY